MQVVKEARQLGAFCVRGNHDDSALAAYYAVQRGDNVDVRLCSKTSLSQRLSVTVA